MKQILHHTLMGLSEKKRIESITMLNKTLACAIDLQLQAKQAHWNIKGKGFIALHLLLDQIHERVEEYVDTIAERIMALGGSSFGTSQAVVENTQLRTYPTDIFKIEEHLEHLTHNFAILGEIARNNIAASAEFGDMGTNDLFIGLSRMLR